MKNWILLYFHKMFTMSKNNNIKIIRQLFYKKKKLKVKSILVMIG
jgi:hypothetical protein